MKKFPCLVLRSGTYYVRMKVPSDLVPVLKRRELKRSLNTKSGQQARQQYQRVYGKLLRTVTEARDRLAAGRAEPAAVPQEILERAVREWFFQLWDRCEAGYMSDNPTGPTTDEMVEQAEFELAALTEPDEQLRGMLKFQAEKMLAERGFAKPRAADVETLASYIRRGMGLVNRAVIDHYRNRRFHHVIDDPLFQPLGGTAAGDEHAPAHKVPSVSDLIGSFKTDPQRQKLSPKNALGFKMSFRLLEEIAGADTPITAVSREHAREVQSLLCKLPPNATKRFRGTPLTLVAKLADERGLKSMEAGTAENILRNLSAFFAWECKSFAWKHGVLRISSALLNRRQSTGRRWFWRSLHRCLTQPGSRSRSWHHGETEGRGGPPADQG